MKSVDLSVIITAHAEGLLAHKTMLSLESALVPLKENKISYEILVHLDRPDAATEEYFRRYEKDPRVKIFKNSFGCPGPSRNFAVKKAAGEVISVLDGDDLISENWLLDSYRQVKNSAAPIVVHPEANLTFGPDVKNQVLWIQRGSIDKRSDALLSVGINRWISTATAPRSVFLAHPYLKNGDGFGNEDYYFNTETLAADIRHEVAPGTVEFYRRKSANSVFNLNLHAAQPYSALLDLKFFQSFASENKTDLSLTVAGRSRRNAYELARDAYRRLRRSALANKILTPLAYHTVNFVRRSNRSDVPDFVLDAWRKISRIEAALYPTRDNLRALVRYDSEAHLDLGLKYLDLIKNVPDFPDYIFLVPWIVPGGADKVLLNYLKAFSELHPSWRIAVVTTVPGPNPWAKLLPPNAFHLDFGNVASDLEFEVDRDTLFTRLLVQLKSKNLHIINSEYAYQWAAKHLALLKNYKVNVSLFCHDIVPGTKGDGIFDYADPYLLEIYPVVDRIFTDNRAVIDRSVKLNNFTPEKFSVQYQPSDLDLVPPAVKPKLKDGKFHILWASRIAAQKHPELLKKIAAELSPNKYQIDVYGRLDGEYGSDFFADSPVIKYHGAYDGITSLDPANFNLFLYTSLIDGLPNILLEVASLGLPIIASDAGGVKEFVKDEKTGRLISDDDPKTYAAAIRAAAKDPETFRAYAENAQSLLKKQHSFSAYLKKLKEDF